MSHRKILHAADIHLDSPLQKLDIYENAPADEIRGASRLALENMTQLAIDQAVDLVVIAGDLYDGDWPDQNTGLFFVRQAARLVQHGIPIVVIRGNHDAANKMTSSLPLPNNPDGSAIMMDEKKVDLRHFEDIGIAVHGRSYRKRAEKGDLAKSYPSPLTGVFNLGLLHTGLSGFEGHDNYAPCTPQQLADKEYDYWALGHIHKRGEHQIEGAAPVVFSGNVQGRHIRESGPKGCVIVNVDSRNRCSMQFHPLDVVRWETCLIDGTSIEHPDEVPDHFDAWLRRAIDEADDRLLVPRVRVEGDCPVHDRLVSLQDKLEQDLRAITLNQGASRVWLERLKIRTHRIESRVSSEADSESMQGPLASVHATAEQLASDPQAAKDWIGSQLATLMKKLPKEFTGDDSPIHLDDPEEIKRLVDEATAELVGRLQGDIALQIDSPQPDKPSKEAMETLF